MKKNIRKNIAKSLIFSQLLLNNSCIANTNTPKTWQEKSVKKLQSFAKEIKSSMKADPGWWIAGTIGLVALVASPFVANHFRQMPKNFEQEFASIKSYFNGENSVLDKILTFEKLGKTVEVVCNDYNSNEIILPSITNTNVSLYYDFCVGADCNLEKLLEITTEFLQNSERKIIFIGGIYPNHGAKLKNLLSVYLMCLLRLNFPDRVFIVSHKSGTERAGFGSTERTEEIERIIAQFNSVFAKNENLDEILFKNTTELKYLPDENFIANLNNQEEKEEQNSEEEFARIYKSLGDSSYIPEKSLKYAIDTASDLMDHEKTIIEFSNNNTAFVASDIHGDYSCLKFFEF